VKVKFDELMKDGVMRLFRSERPDIPDGAQRRDFIWVGDVVDVLLWAMGRPDVNGLYNLGTGQSATYLALAESIAAAAGREAAITFIDMPAALSGQYQYHTEAPMRRLRAAGYARPFLAVAEGVRRYVQDHLRADDPYR